MNAGILTLGPLLQLLVTRLSPLQESQAPKAALHYARCIKVVSCEVSEYDAANQLRPGSVLLHHMETQGSASVPACGDGGKLNCCVTMETGDGWLWSRVGFLHMRTWAR